MSKSTKPADKKQVRLNRRLCDEATIAHLRFALAVSESELALWRQGLQQKSQQTKMERDNCIRAIATDAGIQADEYEFNLDEATATLKDIKNETERSPSNVRQRSARHERRQ